MIAIGHEADVLALGLLGDQLESELVRDGARLWLCLVSHGENHARQYLAVDAPQEVALVFRRVEPAMQYTVGYARIVASGDPPRVDRICLGDEIAELRERVAAHAGNRRAPA